MIGLDLHKRESQLYIAHDDGTIQERRIVTSRARRVFDYSDDRTLRCHWRMMGRSRTRAALTTAVSMRGPVLRESRSGRVRDGGRTR
jgi:hypothetical protein